MAVTAREVVMVFRGQNYLSSAIRKVGRDVQGLSRSQQLQLQRQQLQVVGQRLNASRQTAVAELKSVQSGARRLGLEKEIAAQQLVQLRQAAQLEETQARASRLNRLVGAGRPLRGFTMDETRQLAAAAQLRAQAAADSISKQSLAVEKLNADEARLIEREAQLTQIINTRSAAIDLNTEKLRQNALAMDMLPWERFESGARYVEHAGRVLQMFGLIAGASLGFAASQAAKFQTQITLAATQSTLATNNTTAQVLKNAAVLQKAVEQLIAAGTTAKPEELTSGLYAVLSGVSLRGNQQQQLRQAVDILGQFNKVLTANYGQVEFNDVVRAGIALINNFGLSARSLPQVLNRMQASVRFGAMNMRDFTNSLNQVVPAFRGAHYNFNQMAADIAFVSRLFPSLRFGTTGLARLTETFARYHDEISKSIGTNIAPGGKLLPIDQIVAAIIRARPELAKGGVDLSNYFKNTTGATSTVQARRVFIGYATQLGLYSKIARQVKSDNNELSKSFTDMSQTPQVRWAEFANQLRLLVLEVGAGAIPAFQAFSKPIKDLANWFNNLSPATQHAIGYITAFSALIALLGGTLAAITGGIGVLVARGGQFIRWTQGSKAELEGLAGEAGSVSARFAIGLGIVGLIPLFIHFHSQIGAVTDKLGGLSQVLRIITAISLAVVVRRNVAALGLLAAEGDVAASAMTKLRLALGLLSLIGTIVVTVDVVRQIIDKYLPGLHDPGFTPKPDNIANFAATAAKNKQAIENTKTNVREATPAYRAAVREAEKLFSQGLNVNQVAAKLQRERPGLAHKLAEGLSGPITDALTLYDAYVKGRTKQGTDPTGATIVQKQAQTVQDWIARIERARAKMLGNPNDLAAAQNYEKLQTELNKKFKDQPALLAAINDVLSNYNTNLKDSISNANTLGTTFQDVLQGIQGMYDNFKQTETGLFGTLFQGPFNASQDKFQFGARMTGQDALRDIRSQVRQFQTFHGLINRLQRRGAPQGLIQQLIGLGSGPEQIRNLQALTSLSPRLLSQYFGEFSKGQKLINQATMTDLNKQLAIYRRHGRNIALAIIAGIKSENVGVTNALTNLIRKMFPGLPVGATGAGGRPTHHRAAASTVVVTPAPVHVHPNRSPDKPPISTKAQQRHAELRTRNKFSTPVGGPR